MNGADANRITNAPRLVRRPGIPRRLAVCVLSTIALLLAFILLNPATTLGQDTDQAKPPPVPETPASVTVERSDGALNASWPAVAHATSYHVTYSSDGEPAGAWPPEPSRRQHCHQRR